MMNNTIEATILNVEFKIEDVPLPRIPMIPTDMSVEFKRLQFPVRLAFAMTINNAQGHRYKCVDQIWKIHASHMDNCM
jgi:ATP-dependent DNA helicase PIF1